MARVSFINIHISYMYRLQGLFCWLFSQSFRQLVSQCLFNSQVNSAIRLTQFTATSGLKLTKHAKVVCIHSSKDSPLNILFPSFNTTFLHILPSLLSSSLSPWILILSLNPSIHLSLCRHFLRVPSGYYSVFLPGDLFPTILFTCRNTVTAFLHLLLIYSSKHPHLS